MMKINHITQLKLELFKNGYKRIGDKTTQKTNGIEYHFKIWPSQWPSQRNWDEVPIRIRFKLPVETSPPFIASISVHTKGQVDTLCETIMHVFGQHIRNTFNNGFSRDITIGYEALSLEFGFGLGVGLKLTSRHDDGNNDISHLFDGIVRSVELVRRLEWNANYTKLMYVDTNQEYLGLTRGDIVYTLSIEDMQHTALLDGVMDARATHLKNVVRTEVVGGMSRDAAVKAANDGVEAAKDGAVEGK